MNYKKVLVIDDEKINRIVLNSFLTKKGYQVCEATDGAMALEMLLQTDGIFSILLDLHMPIVDGYGFLKKVQNETDAVCRNIPVIVVSTNYEEAFRKKCNAERIDITKVRGYLQKPVDMELLGNLLLELEHAHDVVV